MPASAPRGAPPVVPRRRLDPQRLADPPPAVGVGERAGDGLEERGADGLARRALPDRAELALEGRPRPDESLEDLLSPGIERSVLAKVEEPERHAVRVE